MFESLFQYPTVLQRHCKGPAADERQRFLVHRANEGAAHGTLLQTARELRVIANYIDVKTDNTLDKHGLEIAAEKWARQQQRGRRSRSQKWSRELFMRVGTAWLRFLGRWREPELAPRPFADLVQDFVHFMREERGLSEVTIRARCWHVDQFLTWLSGQHRRLADASVRDVDAFLSGKGARNWGRVSVATSAKALRAFFRHAELRGWCPRGVATGINGPRLFTLEALPVGPAWADVQKLITTAHGTRPSDIRDQAILELFAVYSFRTREVAGLRLEQIDWERETITILRSKQRRSQEYPLLQSVGQAIIRYLRQVRPRCSQREIFLTLNAPFRPLSPGALYNVVNKRLCAQQIESLRHGPHSLRHACAGHLVAEGFSLKQVGDHLGHRSASATRIYAKVDLPGLREVGNFDLGGLL